MLVEDGLAVGQLEELFLQLVRLPDQRADALVAHGGADGVDQVGHADVLDDLLKGQEGLVMG